MENRWTLSLSYVNVTVNIRSCSSKELHLSNLPLIVVFVGGRHICSSVESSCGTTICTARVVFCGSRKQIRGVYRVDFTVLIIILASSSF